MSVILLVRHAKNDWVGKRLPGHTPGIRLSEEGHQEARDLAARLDGYPLEAVYSSSLERALQTALYVAEPRGLAVIEEPRLKDVDTGDFTGREITEAAKDPLWISVQFAPSLARFPGGESISALQARAVSALEEIRTRHTKPVLVVAHADVIKVLIAHYVGLPLDLFQRLEIDTASVSTLSFGKTGAHLHALNYTGGLPSLPAEDGTESGTDGTPEEAPQAAKVV